MQEKTSCPDMLAFPYKINKIIRDIKSTPMPNKTAEIKRDSVIAALHEVCRTIENEFQ